MVKAIGLPRERLCLYCWTGECPKKGSFRGSAETKKREMAAKNKRFGAAAEKVKEAV
jgi:hypothetical protein